MKFWFDTKFVEDGKTIDLISIGIVAEDGREYYAENYHCDYEKASPWVKENVFPYLLDGDYTKTRAQIRDEVLAFIGQDDPEIWAYYADYDHVVLAQLFGTMMDLPKGWPMFCHDLKQLIGDHKCFEPEIPHNALSDAIAVKATYEAFTRG